MGKKILLADDSITIQKVIELTFSDQEFDVVTVGNGRLALEKLEEVRPDIVLCDIIMPEKDGYEVCEQIKSSSAFSHVPVLLLTGAFEPFDQERASQVGSDGFLAKPFEPDTLIAKVKDLLSRAGVASDSGASPAPASPSPVVEMVPPPPPPTEPAAPSGGVIPDEPFAPIEPVDFEDPSAATGPPPPLAAVTAEESATLAGEGESRADTSSTVMFSTADLPGTGGAEGSPEPPATPEATAPDVTPVSFAPPDAMKTTEPEPVFAPEPTGGADLADTAGAAFEEILEDDREFAGGRRENPAASGSALADAPATQTQAPIVASTGSGAPQESPTLKVAVPAMPQEQASGARPPLEAFEPMAPEPPAVEEAEPVETFEPLSTGSPAVFAPEPGASPASGPIETFEPAPPAAPELIETFEPVPPASPELIETFEPAPPAAPELIETFEPAPPAAPEPIETFEPVPPAAPEPIETFEPAPPASPELIETFEPAPPASPEPIETFEPAPPASPEPIETFEPVPPAAPEPIETFEPVPPAAPEPIETFEPVPPAAPAPPVVFEPGPSPEAPAFFEPVPAAPVVAQPAPSSGAGAGVVETLPPTGPADSAGEPPPPVLDRQPAPTVEPEPELAATEEAGSASGSPSATATPGAARADVVESFGDLGPGDEPDPVAPSSEAASVPVPVDMVEKIAQRVVSQVSEKVVREIAWEVIPDLAEALIKQEIERLKAEIQKL